MNKNQIVLKIKTIWVGKDTNLLTKNKAFLEKLHKPKTVKRTSKTFTLFPKASAKIVNSFPTNKSFERIC